MTQRQERQRRVLRAPAIADLTFEQFVNVGIIDTIRFSIAEKLHDADRGGLSAWNQGTHFQKHQGRTFSMWSNRETGVRVFAQGQHTVVEGSVPRALGRDNAFVNRIGLNRTFAALDAMTRRLLPNTTKSRLHALGLGDQENSIQKQRAAWQITRIDFARDFRGPVAAIIAAYTHAKWPLVKNPTREIRYQDGGVMLSFQGKNRSLKIYAKGFEVRAKSNRAGKRKESSRAVPTGSDVGLGRVELSFKNAQGLGKLAQEFQVHRDLNRRPVVNLGHALSLNLLVGGDAMVRIVSATLADLHSFLAWQLTRLEPQRGFGASLNGLAEVALEAMARDEQLLGRYMSGTATRQSKSANRQRVVARRVKNLRATLAEICYPSLWRRGADVAKNSPWGEFVERRPGDSFVQALVAHEIAQGRRKR
ncbi:MAG: hypothetical protein IT462_14595 [Planctomycetes bacterium]|nr:hypothetical protein [Planctomycetota bacterium]